MDSGEDEFAGRKETSIDSGALAQGIRRIFTRKPVYNRNRRGLRMIRGRRIRVKLRVRRRSQLRAISLIFLGMVACQPSEKEVSIELVPSEGSPKTASRWNIKWSALALSSVWLTDDGSEGWAVGSVGTVLRYRDDTHGPEMRTPVPSRLLTFTRSGSRRTCAWRIAIHACPYRKLHPSRDH